MELTSTPSPMRVCAGDSPGQFDLFEAETIALFEAALVNPSPVTWQSGGFEYSFDVLTFEQVNESNGTRRAVQRVVAGKVTHEGNMSPIWRCAGIRDI